MTKEQKLQTIMEHKGISDVEVEVEFTSDIPIFRESFDEYEKIKEIKERCRAAVARKLGVSPNVLKGCDTDDVIELMETIFWIEANGENEVKVVDGKIILDIPSLYDEVYITGSQANWKDIIAIYAIKTNTDADNPQEIATIDENKKGIISDIFWDMNTITTKTETKTEEKIEKTIDEEGNEVETVTTITKTYLTITISSKTAEDMIQEYGFTDEQKKMFNDLTDSKNDKLWNGLIFGMNSLQTIDISTITFTNEEAGEVQKKVVSIATNSSQYGVPANKGYCQAWVADVLQIAVGTRGHAASAVDAGRKWSVSKDWSQIQVGATVYGYSSSQWGHVGIYIGNGMVAHNIGGVKIESLSDWVSTYKGVCWGWEQGINLSGNSKYNSVGGLM